MEYTQFKERCKKEFLDKNPFAKEKIKSSFIRMVISISVLIILLIVAAITSSDENSSVVIYPSGFAFIWCIASVVDFVRHDRKDALASLKAFVKGCKKSGTYKNYPYNYPNSILYRGEPYPFAEINQSDTILAPTTDPIDQPAISFMEAESAPAPAPIAPAPVPVAPAPAPVAPAPTPESIVTTCEKCGQQMLIPSGSGTVKLTCPKCGSDIIHTYNN